MQVQELANKVFLDYIMFTGVEALIFLLYYIFDRKVKIQFNVLVFSFIIVSIINSTLYFLLPQLIFQVIAILYMSLLLSIILKQKITKSFVSILKISIIMIIIEILYSMILKMFFNIELVNQETTLNKFLLCIPFRIMEFIVIYYKYRRWKS